MTSIIHAFPSAYNPQTGAAQYGMTLRDYIAIQALQGMLSNPSLFDSNGEFQENNITVAFDIADIVMKVRDA